MNHRACQAERGVARRKATVPLFREEILYTEMNWEV